MLWRHEALLSRQDGKDGEDNLAFTEAALQNLYKLQPFTNIQNKKWCEQSKRGPFWSIIHM